MIHREGWVLAIFIQHQYPVLTDAYKRQSVISLKNQQENLQETEYGQNAVKQNESLYEY